jgi:hypothetical protein
MNTMIGFLEINVAKTKCWIKIEHCEPVLNSEKSLLAHPAGQPRLFQKFVWTEVTGSVQYRKETNVPNSIYF